jgi:hypothetical protein
MGLEPIATTINSAHVYKSAMEPSKGIEEGDLWINTTGEEGYGIYIYEKSDWIKIPLEKFDLSDLNTGESVVVTSDNGEKTISTERKVDSVNGQTGSVNLTTGVSSVNGQTGAVNIDVGSNPTRNGKVNKSYPSPGNSWQLNGDILFNMRLWVNARWRFGHDPVGFTVKIYWEDGNTTTVDCYETGGKSSETEYQGITSFFALNEQLPVTKVEVTDDADNVPSKEAFEMTYGTL